jgi:tyrosinase
MHTEQALREAHGDTGFLPWHRAYLLDLERELQSIDPSVALPYWRFDRPAPELFSPEFLGQSNGNGRMAFAPDNPLQFWRSDNGNGISRTPRFTITEAPQGLLTELQTIRLGTHYVDFVESEGNPHGYAHTSFMGDIGAPATAPKDPLFFLLHANVDRLWAKWQWVNRRYRTPDPDTFADSTSGRKGHRLTDSMWPWNQDTAPPRPSTAPGGSLAASPCAAAPGPAPLVQQMIDYQGLLALANRLGFDYDDVPFASELPA